MQATEKRISLAEDRDQTFSRDEVVAMMIDFIIEQKLCGHIYTQDELVDWFERARGYYFTHGIGESFIEILSNTEPGIQ